MAVGVDGSIAVAGTTAGKLFVANRGRSDVWLAKYNGSGGRQWGRQWGSAWDEHVADVAVDAAGTIFMTGSTTGSLFGLNRGGVDAWALGITTAGRVRAGQFGTAGDDNPAAVATDNVDIFYISGTTDGALGGVAGGEDDVWLGKYSFTP